MRGADFICAEGCVGQKREDARQDPSGKSVPLPGAVTPQNRSAVDPSQRYWCASGPKRRARVRELIPGPI